MGGGHFRSRGLMGLCNAIRLIDGLVWSILLPSILVANQGKTGDVELTFIHTFCRGGNLKALMASNSLPEVLGSFRPIIQSHFGKDFRGSILFNLLSLAPESHNLDNEGSDILRMGKQPLVTPSNDVYVLLLQQLNDDGPVPRYRSYTDPFKDCTISLEPKIQCWKSVHKKGVVYVTESQHVGNSFVFFHHSGSSHAGQIQEIFSHSRTTMELSDAVTEFFCVVKPLQELGEVDILRDPYCPYLLLNVRLCYDGFDPIVVIRLQDIITHCATCSYVDPLLSRNARVVLSLDRVSMPVLSQLYTILN